MLGSVHDADDAVQDALLRAWRGLPGFVGRSSLRSLDVRQEGSTSPPALPVAREVVGPATQGVARRPVEAAVPPADKALEAVEKIPGMDRPSRR
jgi:hypothetical protein